MEKRITIRSIYASPVDYADKSVTLTGWVRTVRDSKAFGFIELNDGSYFSSVQIVFESSKIDNYQEIASQNVGAALRVTGKLVLTPDARQPFEIKAE